MINDLQEDRVFFVRTEAEGQRAGVLNLTAFSSSTSPWSQKDALVGQAVFHSCLLGFRFVSALRAMEEARIPAGPVHSPQEALDDVHVRASGVLRQIAFPGATRAAPVVDTPIRLSATPGAIRGRAPLLGEHSDAILAELGYSEAQIAQLRASKVV